MSRFRPMEKPSAFRKIAAVSWKAPNDPTVYASVDVDFSDGRAFTARYREKFNAAITPTHMVARAMGLVLAEIPEINAAVGFNAIHLRQSADVFVPIAAENGRAVTGTKIDAVDRMSLAEIAAHVRRAAQAVRRGDDPEHAKVMARARRAPMWLIRPVARLEIFIANRLGIDLSPRGPRPDSHGGAIISSVSGFGYDSAFIALTPFAPTAIGVAVLDVCSRPWVTGDRVEARTVLRFCLTADHRIVDGHSGGLIARRLKALLSDPVQLLTDAEEAQWQLGSDAS